MRTVRRPHRDEVHARADARAGVFGSGKQAPHAVEAICKVRKIRRVAVFSPNEERRKQFAQEMSQRCEVEVVAVSRPEQRGGQGRHRHRHEQRGAGAVRGVDPAGLSRQRHRVEFFGQRPRSTCR